jgi:hypothetical protein
VASEQEMVEKAAILLYDLDFGLGYRCELYREQIVESDSSDSKILFIAAIQWLS